MTDWHPYPYNFSNGTSVDGVGSFFGSYPASIVSMTGTGIIVMIWMVVFMLSLVSGAIKAFTVASFVSAILGVYLMRIDLLSVQWVFVLAVMTIVGFLLSKSENEP